MNVLENYIEEIHSVEPYTADWTDRFPDREFVQVDITSNCYGNKQRQKHVFNTKDWAEIQDQGFYWA